MRLAQKALSGDPCVMEEMKEALSKHASLVSECKETMQRMTDAMSSNSRWRSDEEARSLVESGISFSAYSAAMESKDVALKQLIESPFCEEVVRYWQTLPFDDSASDFVEFERTCQKLIESEEARKHVKTWLNVMDMSPQFKKALKKGPPKK